ncbi:MAG: nucleotide sugar dehydrogenase [Myxococcales bacterium]|nr:nucleotide sugar dehydrogenase [Myxococcales bacterium]
MKIAIFGLGYVGTVSAGCLAARGHQLIGVDPDEGKVRAVRDGRSPILEPGLSELLSQAVREGTLSATSDWERAVADSEMAWICVGTPSRENGDVDLRFVRGVCEQIAIGAKNHTRPYLVVLRSTVPPGTTRSVVTPILEENYGNTLGGNLDVCFHPEFLREGHGVEDFENPSRIVIGTDQRGVATTLSNLYTGFNAAVTRTDLETAELVKYCDNTWHALKVAFANEMGTVAESTGVDPGRLMEIFRDDRKLNISDAYLRPGFAFGGSCLPKDVRALRHFGRRQDLTLPLLESLLPSNDEHIDRALRRIVLEGRRRVGMLGLSFKASTDDLRESPLVELSERLIGKGFELRIFDQDVRLAALIGTNRDYVDRRLPHIAKMLVSSIEELVTESEILVVGHVRPEDRARLVRLAGDRPILDIGRVLARGPSPD